MNLNQLSQTHELKAQKPHMQRMPQNNMFTLFNVAQRRHKHITIGRNKTSLAFSA